MEPVSTSSSANTSTGSPVASKKHSKKDSKVEQVLGSAKHIRNNAKGNDTSIVLRDDQDTASQASYQLNTMA